MIQGDLRLDRQGNAPIVHSKHNARWLGALVGGLALIFLSAGFACPITVGLPCLVSGSVSCLASRPLASPACRCSVSIIDNPGGFARS